MKRTLVLLSFLFAVSARASDVAALGDIACGIYTNTASTGIPLSTNDYLQGYWIPDFGSLSEPDWWREMGLIDTNAVPAPDAALVSGQLKWAALCAKWILDAKCVSAGGAGDEIDDVVADLESWPNDEAVTTPDFLSVIDPIAHRTWDLFVHTEVQSVPPTPSPQYDPESFQANVPLCFLKFAFCFDPDHDGNDDGFPDWWERYWFLSGLGDIPVVFPDDDSDFDGLSNREELSSGTSPVLRDSDGDGLVDGIDPEPQGRNDAGDYDEDGIPDALETLWFGDTNVVDSADSLDWAGFRFDMALAAGICPTNPAPAATYPTNGLSAFGLVPRFGVDTTAGTVVWERTIELPRHAAWERYLVSSSPNPKESGDGGAWALDGLVLEWSFEGSATTNSASSGYPLQFPAPLEDPRSESVVVHFDIRTTSAGVASCPRPLYLLVYTPAIEFSGIPSAVAGDALLSAAAAGDDIDFELDWSLSPVSMLPPGDGSDELFFDSLGAGSVSFLRNASGLVVGGTLHGAHAGLFEIPFIAPPALRSVFPLPPPVRRFLLAVLDPRLTYGTGHGPDAAGLAWDGSSYSPTHDYPLDDYELWRSFHSDATGGFVCDCTPELDLGLPDEYVPYFETNIVVTTGSGGRETATASAKLSGSTVWTGTADHDPFGNQSCSVLSTEATCGCKTCKRDGTSAGSVRFRLSLGEPREGQVSGFLWFRSDGPVSVTPQLFELLARSDASVSDTTASGVRTIVCSDARGRTVVASPIADGVRLAVTNTATGEPDHFWTIMNENGFSNRIRFVRTSRAGNVQSDETYVRSPDGAWSVSDNVAGTAETLVRTDALDDRICPTSSVERVLCDLSGLELSHTFVASRRYGEGANAVLRETERREDVDTPYEKASFATYWETGGKRFGLPRLVSGNARAWSWTDYDSRGRPILVFDQRDGAPCPADGTGWTLASHPVSLKAFATVHSYAPIPNSGDSNQPDDDDTPRTTSRYVVEGASSNLISRTWTVMTHGTTSGHPSVSVRTERAASQSATFGDSANAVSVSVSVDPEAPGVPLLLRGRPLSYTDEDGVTTAYEYSFGSWNPATRTFAASSGASHLRTRVFATTPEAPNGVPLVSTVFETVEDAVHGTEVWSATRVLLANGSLSDPFDWEARVYDDRDRLRSTLYADGSSSTNAYSCCRLLFTVGRDGLRRERLADTGTDHLRHAWLDVSFPSLPQNRTTSGDYAEPGAYVYHRPYSYRAVESLFDPLGREIRRRTLATEPNRSASISDLRASNNAWESVQTNGYPFGTSDSSVRVDARGLRTERNVYRNASDVETWTETYAGTNLLEQTCVRSTRGGGSESFRSWDGGWTDNRTFSRYGSDGCRTDFSVTESSDAPAVTNSVSVSDFLGRAVRVVTPLSDSAYAYAGASSRVLSVSDSVSGLSTSTLYDSLREPVGSVSAGVASFSETRYEQSSGVWWRVTETREAAGGVTNLLSTVREQLTGLSDALRSRTVSVPAGGPTSVTTVSFDPATFVSVESNLVDGLAPLVVRSMFGRAFETQERDGTVRRSCFDPYGRVYLTGDQAPGGTFLWRTWTLRDENGDAYADVEVTARGLAAMGLASSRSGFLHKQLPTNNNYTKWSGLLRQHAYDVRGNLVETWDQEDHATVHERDGIGRVVRTYGAAYPSARLLDTAGRLVGLGTTRTGTAWDSTFWDYDPATGLCTNKTYADGTAVAHTFAADGLPLRTTLASGAWTQNAYDASRRLSSVTTSDGEGNVSYLYDAFGRVSRATGSAARYDYARDAIGRATSEVRRTGGFHPSVDSSLSRPYDAYGRPAGYGLSFYGDFRQGVCYTWGMDGKLDSMVVSNAQGRAVEVFFDWERGRGMGWSVGGLGDCEASFRQAFFRAARRPWLVTSCETGEGGFGPPSRSFSYAYDAVGRPVERDSDAFDYDARGQITNAVVDGDAFRYAYDHIGNRQSAYEAGVSTSYSANSVNQYTEVGNDEPEYDDDGNLVDDGTRTFEWSASGRLTEAATPSARLSCVYDHLGRRVSRTTETRSGFRWNLSDEREFVYDGWNLIHEHRYDYQDDSDTDIEYFWGPDLSGTLQGAGGVGGLVAVSVDGDYYFPGYDNNGNVIGYWNEDGDLVAEYAYDAFGNTIYEDGDLADFFPHRFSTKYYDAETDLYYYGYRYYSPSLGRWISRDPIGEEGGYNLFEFCKNTALTQIDYLGLHDFALIIGPNPMSANPVVSKDHVMRYIDKALTEFQNENKDGSICDLDILWTVTSPSEPLTLMRMREAVSTADSEGIPIVFWGHGAIKGKDFTHAVLVQSVRDRISSTIAPISKTELVSWETILSDIGDSESQTKRKQLYVFCCHSAYLPQKVGQFDISTPIPSPLNEGVVTTADFSEYFKKLLKRFCCERTPAP